MLPWESSVGLHSPTSSGAGACEGSLACSTCHVILDDAVFDTLEEPSDEENDMLDLAFGLTETYVSLWWGKCPSMRSNTNPPRYTDPDWAARWS
jgi:hypothetical protein